MRVRGGGGLMWGRRGRMTEMRGGRSLSPFIDLVPPTLTSGWRPCVDYSVSIWGCPRVHVCFRWLDVCKFYCVTRPTEKKNVGFGWILVSWEMVLRWKQRRGNDWAVRVTHQQHHHRRLPRATTDGRDEILSLAIEDDDVDINRASSSIVKYIVMICSMRAKKEKNSNFFFPFTMSEWTTIKLISRPVKECLLPPYANWAILHPLIPLRLFAFQSSLLDLVVTP